MTHARVYVTPSEPPSGSGDSLRILQTVASTNRRGAEIFGDNLGSSLRSRGHTVQTWALAPGNREPLLDLPSLSNRTISLGGLLRLRRFARDVDVVVGHGSRTLPANSLATIGTRVPVVYRSIGDPSFWGTSALRRARTAAFLRRVTAVVVVWQGAAQMIHEMYGVPRDHIRVIPRGVPADRFTLPTAAERADSRKRLGLPPEADVVVYLGSLSHEKNPSLAIRAAARLPNVSLVLVGDGPLRAEMQDLAEDLAPGRVRFLGRVPDPARVLSAADVLVLPSHSEGTPGVVMEAGLMGIPTVASAVGGVPEIIVDGETGVLVPPGALVALTEALTAVLEDPVPLGRSARSWCQQRFALDVVTDAWEEFLRELVGSSRREQRT